MVQHNNRSRTIRYLLITSGILVVSGLGYLAHDLLNPSPPPTVLYYPSEQQCIADASSSKNGLTKEQCHAQFQYAMQEYNRITPIYRSQQACQTDTASICSQVFDASLKAPGWRPDFNGAYFNYEADNDNLTVVHFGSGGYHTVYPVQPVYRSSTGIVTPTGTLISRPQTGVPLASPDFSPSTDIPARPQGYAAQGTIKGRGSFGSSVRSTGPKGSGGK